MYTVAQISLIHVSVYPDTSYIHKDIYVYVIVKLVIPKLYMCLYGNTEINSIYLTCHLKKEHFTAKMLQKLCIVLQLLVPILLYGFNLYVCTSRTAFSA